MMLFTQKKKKKGMSKYMMLNEHYKTIHKKSLNIGVMILW